MLTEYHTKPITLLPNGIRHHDRNRPGNPAMTGQLQSAATPRGRGELRALSIRRPWANLILAGHKTVENRSWTTEHRGLLLIHAGRT